jgi:hypothetical protein
VKWWRKVLWPAANPLPFAGIRWLRLLLILGCVAGTLLSPCSDENQMLQIRMWVLLWVGWVVALLACLWEAHVRILMAGHFHWGKWLGRSTQNALSLLGGVLLLSVPIGILLPAYSCYGNRARVGEVLAVASRTKQLVAEKALDTKTLADVGVGLTLEPNRYLTFGHVSRNGTIMLFVGEAKAAVVLEPSITNPQTGEVTWKCRGAPPRAIPASCRQP